MISWQYYPSNQKCPEELLSIIEVFQKNVKTVSSENISRLKSNEVLLSLSEDLEILGFRVEKNKKIEGKIRVPVLFGKNGKVSLSFDADAYHPEKKIVLEVEAGRGVTNYQFLKDFFQACMMLNVDYFVVAIRITYRKRKDFEQVTKFFDALFASGRLAVPFKGILIIGY